MTDQTAAWMGAQTANEVAAGAFRSAPGILWVRDETHTIVVDVHGERSWRLMDVDQAIWDLLTLNYPFQALVDMVALWRKTPDYEAASFVLATLRTWEASGLVLCDRGAGNG